MTVAYVLEQNASLVKEGERVLIKKDKSVLHTLHTFKLDQIVLFGNIFLTPPAISYLLSLGIDTVFMGRNGRYRGRLQGPYSKNISLRQKQFCRLSDAEFCLNTARSIVAGKLNNLRTVLLRLNRSRDGLALGDHVLGLKKLREKAGKAKDLEALRGFEGKGSALYFEGFAKGILAQGFEFKKRIRRPPTDPVNALLSLGYAFLLNECLGAVSMIGFDPYIGALHTVEYGRPSLPLDLMEEWRPVIVDTLVLSLFNLKTLTGEDFTFEEKPPDDQEQADEYDTDLPHALPVKLTDSGMRKFITQFERKMAQKVAHHLTGQQLCYRDCIREQVRRYARYIRGEEASYQPFVLK